ncbi:MAG TPA: CopG family transcriptional regulator [Thermomicrobiales bacterium]|nr:CopG family transcriptional regulator [Thermomicrobiales bacterium]
MPNNYKPFKVRIRPDQHERLRALATQRGVSVSSLVRDGVDKMIEKDSLLDIIGLVEGDTSDASERHDNYLAGSYADNHDSCDPRSSWTTVPGTAAAGLSILLSYNPYHVANANDIVI